MLRNILFAIVFVFASSSAFSFEISDLSKYPAIAIKSATSTDLPGNKNHQIMGTNAFINILGVETKQYQVEYVFAGKNALREAGNAKWGYICPKSWSGRCKGQITYKNNAIMQSAKPGDTFVIAKKSDDEILVLIAQDGGDTQKQIYKLMNLKQAPEQKSFWTRLFESKSKESEPTEPVVTENIKDWAEVYFTPSKDCENRIIERISGAKKIDIAVYAITNDAIGDAILAAHARGVKIRMVTDRLQAKGKGSLVPMFESKGLAVRTNIKHKIEHNKFAVFDDKRMVYGSYNWTSAASDKNSESCMFFEQTGDKPFSKRFKYLWDLYNGE